MTNKVERPEGTLSDSYKRYAPYIKQWRSNNKDYVKQYNREYQRKMRKDPIKYGEARMRIALRAYLLGQWKYSAMVVSSLGMTKEQFFVNMNTTEEEFKKLLKTHEIDHIVPASWFNKPENKHLKPFAYKYYNIQIVEKKSNRNKHCWIDENEIRTKCVINRMKLDYMYMNTDYSEDSAKKMKALSLEINHLLRQIKKHKK